MFQAHLESRARAVSFIHSFLHSDLGAPEPGSNLEDINARVEVPEEMLHAEIHDANFFRAAGNFGGSRYCRGCSTAESAKVDAIALCSSKQAFLGGALP